MLSLENVTKNYKLDERTTITPVKDVTLHIDKGDFIVIIGRSGTGKITLLNLAAGLVKPTAGKVTIDGQNLAEMTERQLSDMRTQQIGFVFQFPSLLPSFTVLENITMPTMFNAANGTADASRRAMETLKTMGIAGKRDVHPKQLSAGEQKRVVISRSLMNNPQIILADEPTSDLDEKTEREVMSLMKEINQRGVAFMMVTHSLGLLPFATRAFEMQHGVMNEITQSVKAGTR